MALTTADAVRQLESAFAAVGTPERAAREQAYLKSDLTFLGATLWQTRAAVKDVGSSRVDLQACKLEYSIVSPK